MHCILFCLFLSMLLSRFKVFVMIFKVITVNINSFSSVTQSCPTLCDPMDCSTPCFPVHHQLLKPAQTHVHRGIMPSNHLILCCPLLLPPSIFPSIGVFSNECISFLPSLLVMSTKDLLVLGTQLWKDKTEITTKEREEARLTPGFLTRAI